MSIGKGIKLSTGFDLNSQSPLDNRTVFKTVEERDTLPNINLYEGLKCFIEDTKENYQYKNGEWVSIDAWDDIIVTSDVDNKKTILSFYSNTVLKKQIELDESIDPNELNIWDDAIVTKDEINNRNVISFYSNGVLQKTIYIDGLGEGTEIKEIQYGDVAPTNSNILLWIDTSEDSLTNNIEDELIIQFQTSLSNMREIIDNLTSEIEVLKARIDSLEQNQGGENISYTMTTKDGYTITTKDGDTIVTK